MRELVLAVVGAGLLVSAPAPAAPAWTYAASDHFEVYTTAGDRRARDALVAIERVRTFFADFLKLSPATGNPTRLIIFSSAAEFAPYRPNEVATAFYQPGPDRDYIVMRSFDADSLPLVVHEYAHLVFRHAGAAYPPWLNEGLAEFFATLTLDAGAVRLGRVPAARLQYLVSGVKLIDLPRLLAIDRTSQEYNSRVHAGVFYSESWALTHMLLTDSKYQAQTPKFLDLMAAGAAGPATLESVYGTTLAAIQRDLSGYVGQGSYRVLIVPYKSQKDVTVPPARDATAFDAGLAIANLLAVTNGGEAEARRTFDGLARQQPDSLALAESRAFFEWRRGQAADAALFLARAVDLGSVNAEVYRRLATMSETGDADRAEHLRRRALDLDPENIDDRLTVAEATFRRQDPAGALALVAGITRVPPDYAFRLFRLLANADVMLGKLDDANAAALRLVQAARPGGETEYAEVLAASIRQYREQQASVDRALAEALATRPGAEGASPDPAAPAAPAARAGSDGAAVGGSAAAQLLARDAALYVTATGRARDLICGPGAPILEVMTATTTLRLVIDDPKAIQVLGKPGAHMDLTCGPQDLPVKVSYEPAIDPARATVGKVRVLDFGARPR